MWPAVTGRTRSWEAAGRETLVGKNEERSPLSSYEINVNVLNEVGFKKDQGSSELLTYVKKKKKKVEQKHGCGYKQQVEAGYNSIKYYTTNFQVVCTAD